MQQLDDVAGGILFTTLAFIDGARIISKEGPSAAHKGESGLLSARVKSRIYMGMAADFMIGTIIYFASLKSKSTSGNAKSPKHGKVDDTNNSNEAGTYDSSAYNGIY